MSDYYDDFYARERILREHEDSIDWISCETVPEDLLAEFDDVDFDHR